ncbi:hypothetical protein Ptr902_02188 [Pyrenophora tritici-repentis]|nr:hypothetical protein Ptr902_02188 [Pyrenophora tritici-repentis]
MAPAVQYHQSKMFTITTITTQQASQTAGVVDSAVADVLANDDDVLERETSTCCHISYTPVTSTNNTQHSEKESDHLQIHGVVPGGRRVNVETSSNPGSPPLHSAATTPHTLPHEQTTATTPPTPRKTSSSYPRPSPPGFLYPDPIVPPSVSLSQFADALADANAITAPRALIPMSQPNTVLIRLPTEYKLLLLATLIVAVLAAAWSLLVCCMSVPPGWWKKGWGNGQGKKKERRPVDKVSKYRGVRETHGGGQDGEEIEMRHQPRHTLQRNITWDGQQVSSSSTYGNNATATVRQRVVSSAPGTPFPPTSTSTAASALTPNSTLSSPVNPFLDPPTPNTLHEQGRVRRTSMEWKRDHAAFFHSTYTSSSLQNPFADTSTHTAASTSTSRFTSIPLTPRRPYSRSRSPRLSPIHRTDTEALEAMEAGTAPPPAGSTADEKSDVLSKSMSFIGEGLGIMDGAVDGFVARVARWTDDEGGEKASSLLP